MKLDNNKVVAYELNDKTVFTLPRENTSFKMNSKFLANGKGLDKSYRRDLYVVDGKLNNVVLRYEEEKSRRYELKNKDLYNEKIPMIIDEHSKEKYQSLIANDLYKVEVDYETKEKEYEIETILIDKQVPFDLKSDIAQKRKGWYSEPTKPFYISLMEYSPLHEAVMPFPMVDLTCPVRVSKENAFLMFVDIFSKLPQKGYVITRSEQHWLDVHKTRMKDSKHLLHFLQFSDYYVFREDIYGEDYNDLVYSIEKLAKDISKALKNEEYDKPLKLIELFRQERYYPKEMIK